MKTRNEIEEKYKWDLSCFGVNDGNFYAKCDEIKKLMEEIYKFKGKLETDDDIYKVMKLDDKIDRLIEPLDMFIHLKSVEDLSLSKYDEMSDFLEKIEIEYNQKTLFVTEKLKKLSNKQINDMLAQKRFEEWELYLKKLKDNRKHRVSNSVDKFLAGADFLGGNNEIMEKFTDVDMTFPDVEDGEGKKHEFNESNAISYLQSDDRILRRNAIVNLHGTYGKYINMFSTNYIYSVKEDCFFAKGYKFKNAMARSMNAEEVKEKIYITLIKNVRENLPLLFDYFELKRQKLGLNDFYNYDAYATLDVENNKKFTYDEAIELIKKAVAPLGEDYVSLIQRAKDERWIDVFPNKNKRGGAFETSIYGYHPFVMTNFNCGLEDVFTLAHELGHAMHSYYSDKAQNYEKAQYKIFVAEVASTTNEMLLLQYLLKNAKSDKEKECYYNKLFESVKSTIFRQTMFAEFEEKVHAEHENGGALSKDKLCDIYYKLNEDYFGKKVKLMPEVKFEWARIPHFFSPFYVYKYAIGLICALNFAEKLFNQETGARENYINKFLCAGKSKPPVEILKEAGCDLEKQETYTETFEYLQDMLKAWKKL